MNKKSLRDLQDSQTYKWSLKKVKKQKNET